MIKTCRKSGVEENCLNSLKDMRQETEKVPKPLADTRDKGETPEAHSRVGKGGL